MFGQRDALLPKVTCSPPAGDLEIALGFRLSLLKNPSRSQKMMSKTFWKRFDVKARHPNRVVKVAAALQAAGIELEVDGDFGSEGPKDWIVLNLPDAPPWPSDDWFQRMNEREFESEGEVEYYFAMNLLKYLGYREEDVSLHHNLLVHHGATAKKMQAYIVLFADKYRNDAILVVEAKHVTSSLKKKDFGQAKSYAIELHAPLYLVTNGDDTQLMARGFGSGPDRQILEFHRKQLKDRWPEIVEHLSRDAVFAYKQRLKDQFEGLS